MSNTCRVFVFCEGQTEESFVDNVLGPYFYDRQIFLTPIVLRTSRDSRGGVVSYGQVKNQVQRKCREDVSAFITTMIDLYALPADFPGMAQNLAATDTEQRVDLICDAFAENMGQPNFIPNIMAHEFEAILFSATSAFAPYFDDGEAISSRLNGILNQFGGNPERIDGGRETAPSKRILDVCHRYDKVLYGSVISSDIGLDIIRGKCKIFNKWICKLESLVD